MKVNYLTVVTHTELAELYNGINDLARILADMRASGVDTEVGKGASVINSLRRRIGKWSILHAYREDGTEKDGIQAHAINECDVYAHGLFIIDGQAKPESEDCPACAKEEEDEEEDRDEEARDREVEARR